MSIVHREFAAGSPLEQVHVVAAFVVASFIDVWLHAVSRAPCATQVAVTLKLSADYIFGQLRRARVPN